MRIDPAADRMMTVMSQSRREREPWRRLVREVMHLAGDRAELLNHSEKAWASVTFSGARHAVRLAFTGRDAMDAADDFIVALPDHEFTISGWIVVDAAIITVEQQVLPEPKITVEASLLLLEEG